MRLLATYLNDHRAAALGIRDLARRTQQPHDGTPLGDDLVQLLRDLDDDLRLLGEVMRRLGVRADPVKHAAGWLGEKVGRLKPNGHLWTRSPLSTVVELEGLMLGVQANAMVLRTLSGLTQRHSELAGLDLDAAAARAEGHRQALERHRAQAAAGALGA